ncbi:carboxymuconolactone decarboxylase family protein [Comamonas sp. Y6]|uniref:Carboxymuconolactone decarboxylase family protein n=1 Tax=Comamonas resistens TaxID=3046670 RepID=A0ABY8SV57_9BURK|nr:carboxymuconolactone decarboxylase family protein [Comamonas resistens]MDL5035767.1 carboxymuconolactone decarboxylase family protein [Comamonas resistens]WHS65181.1 carboxymuconolactone decarboxylase family protein [Comamonas resistens]HBP0979034.1 carboxymuconolactone decarboxylase family protein [Pseudomonas aeruginosa]
MTSNYKQLTQDVMANLAPLHKGVPQVMKGFGEMGKAAIADGALDAKTKELIALAIGVASRCDGCIAFHTKALAKLGATEAEVHEALGVAIYMGGGPSAMYASNAVAAFNEFLALTGNSAPSAPAQ